MTERYWETVPLKKMTREQWEGLCDGCGKCCLHKLQDDETGQVTPTNIACRLLDSETARCTDYRHRMARVPDCIRLTARNLKTFPWLPKTCAYRLLGEGKPLPDWHYLISGDREMVHEAGESVRGWTIGETEAGDPEHHCIDREL
ncbi:MAG: YcgN family cysteine cluster protein [Sphingomonadaceae bacterium]|nr:YcgN family cysteine cluster protein [Sphingomonadaceae bacterium]